MGRAHVQKWSLLVGAWVLAGCYSYIPAEVSELPVGRPVRVQLSRQAFADLPQISDRMGTRLEGMLMNRTDTQLTMRVPIEIGSQFGQDMTLPANGIIQSDVKVLSRPKSALMVVGVVGALVGAVLGSRSDKPIIMNNPGDPPPGDEGGFHGGVARMSLFARALSFSIPIP